ncbi:MAG: hypothetical protein Ct9H90mP2_08940 [Dehalococcoidia bacterium]|nr:MAG: hypothetical protein Ct9H90mP2_08940 [Dehalococcoidia bacterium]
MIATDIRIVFKSLIHITYLIFYKKSIPRKIIEKAFSETFGDEIQ